MPFTTNHLRRDLAGGDQFLESPGQRGEIDDREDYGEDRFIITGRANGRLLTVTYTERDGRIRIISARKATRREQDDYFGQDF